MTGQEFLEKLLQSYQSAFDITRPYDVNGDKFDAYAAFNVTSAKYVLVKKAELWRANCFEHTFFACRPALTTEDLARFREDIVTFIEPQLVRGGEACTAEHHMYTYITGIFIFENYRLGFRGYAEARLLVFDRENHKVLGNRAAKDLVKGYEKVRV